MLLAVLVVAAGGLAGCASNETGDGGDAAVTGTVAENTVDGIEVLKHEPTVEEDALSVEMTVENTGDETTSVDFDILVDVYDAEGAQMALSGHSTTWDEVELEPGETSTVWATSETERDPSEVASYEVNVSCDMFSDSPYCE